MPIKAVRNPALDVFIKETPAPLRPILKRLRELIFSSAPALREEIKWGQPTYCLNGNVVYLSVHKDHINLGFYAGMSLADSQRLLTGTGKGLRHVKIYSVADIQRVPMSRLIRQAAQLASDV